MNKLALILLLILATAAILVNAADSDNSLMKYYAKYDNSYVTSVDRNVSSAYMTPTGQLSEITNTTENTTSFMSDTGKLKGTAIKQDDNTTIYQSPTGSPSAGGSTAQSLNLLSGNIINAAVLMDPSSGRNASASWSSSMACDYCYFAPGSTSSVTSGFQPDSGLVSNYQGTTGGAYRANFGNVLFADGHVAGFASTVAPTASTGWAGAPDLTGNVKSPNLQSVATATSAF